MTNSNFKADRRVAGNEKHRAPFGKLSGDKNTWDKWAHHAESERAVMTAEFHAWLVKTRIETEAQLFNSKQHQRGIAPFAQAGLDEAGAPADLPLCVIEFAMITLEVMELRRKLDLLNVYYSQAANDRYESSLQVEKGNEAEVNILWDWFIQERNSEVSA